MESFRHSHSDISPHYPHSSLITDYSDVSSSSALLHNQKDYIHLIMSKGSHHMDQAFVLPHISSMAKSVIRTGQCKVRVI